MEYILLEPLKYSFMIEALGMASLVGTVCALLSCYLVLKGWSLLGDAISHAVFPGIVIAYLMGAPLAAGAFVSGLVCAAATGWIRNHSRIKEDAVLGVVFTGLFAFGLVLFTKIESDVHLNHILFGSLLGIEYRDMIQVIVISLLVLGVLAISGKDILLYCFDRGYAHGIGLNTFMLHYLFLSLVAATIVSALQAVGIILTVAMLITPGCTAFLLTDRFARMLVIAVFTSILSAIIGTYASYYVNGATGACIVLSQSAFFVVAMFIAPKYGICARYLRLRPNSLNTF